MGQPIVVTRKPSPDPNVVRFEINRSLTGMGHERYRSIDDVIDDRPPDLLARRLFEAGGVRSVHIYANMIAIEVDPGTAAEPLADVIRELYIHYKPGVEPSFTA